MQRQFYPLDGPISTTTGVLPQHPSNIEEAPIPSLEPINPLSVEDQLALSAYLTSFAKSKPGKAGEVGGEEHTKGTRPSTIKKHQKGQTRKQQVNRDKKRQNPRWKQNPNKRK